MDNNLELNEFIDEGQDPFIDDRENTKYYLKNKVNQVGLIDSKKGTVGGNHYHPEQLQTCILIRILHYIAKNLKDDNSVLESRLLKGRYHQNPCIAHTMVFIEDSVFVI